jgi:hypothetical protein
MSTAVKEVLGLWRQAERLLEALAPVHPDHETVRLMVARLNQTYQNLTDRGPNAEAHLADSRAVTEQARALLLRVNVMAREDRAGGSDEDPGRTY